MSKPAKFAISTALIVLGALFLSSSRLEPTGSWSQPNVGDLCNFIGVILIYAAGSVAGITSPRP